MMNRIASFFRNMIEEDIKFYSKYPSVSGFGSLTYNPFTNMN